MSEASEFMTPPTIPCLTSLRDPSAGRTKTADKDRVATVPVEDDPLAGEEPSVISIATATSHRTALRPSPDDFEPVISLVFFLLG